MPAKTPQEPRKISAADRIRAARRAEREEARRQKRELARIEREMRGPGPLWLWPAILGGLALVALLVFLGYRVWASTVVENARAPFAESMKNADTRQMESYAAADWNRVLDMKRRAEAGQVGALETARLYREADQLLATATVAAREAASKVEFVRRNFEQLYNKARELDVPSLLPELWEEVGELRAKAMADGMDSDEAAALFRRGIALLDGISIEFPRIEELRREMAFFAEHSEGFSLAEYANAFPEEAAALTSKLDAAAAAIRRRNWVEATAAYRSARQELPAARARFDRAKEEAVAALAAFDQALAAAREQGAARDAQASWRELGSDREELDGAFAESRYLAVKEAADKGVARVNEMVEQIATARSTLRQRMRKVEEDFQAATVDTTFFAANMAEEWAEVVAAHEVLTQAVARGEDMVSLLGYTDKLQSLLDKIAARRDEMLAGLTVAKNRIDALRAHELAGLIDLNLPQQSEPIFLTSREAQRAEERGDVAQAYAKYREWADLLEKALKDVDSLREETMALAQSCGTRTRDFRVGIERFRAANQAVIEQLTRRSLQLIRENNFRAARPLLKRLDGLVPEQRFTFDRPGAVSDNRTGLMWASDGQGPGCMDGRLVNWHEALRWVGGLDFAGFRDWRLPSEDELRMIGRLSAEERERAFPNTPLEVYWSEVPDTDVNRALAVDLATSRTVLRRKNDPLRVRAVRSPR